MTKAIIFSLGILLCLAGPDEGAADPGAPGSSAPRIGFIVPLSGPLAEIGEAVRNGIFLARESSPAASRAFEPIFEDSKDDAGTAAEAFERLENSVRAIYVAGGTASEALSPLAEAAEMPMFSAEHGPRCTRSKKFVIRFANDAEDYTRAVLGVLRERRARRFAIVKLESPSDTAFSDAFLHSLASGERAAVLATFIPGEKDFRFAVAKIKAHEPDALGVLLGPGMQGAFLRQLRTAGVTIQLFGGPMLESPRENNGLERFLDGALYATRHVSDEFAKAYRSRFGPAQLGAAAQSYEFGLLLGSLFGTGEAPAGGDFVTEFALERGIRGEAGEFFYRRTAEGGQYFSFPIAVRELRNGAPSTLKVEPAP